MNDGRAILTSRDPEEWIGQNLWMVFPGFQNTIIEQTHNRVMDERTPLQVTLEDNNSVGYIEHLIYPTQDGIGVIGRDPSEGLPTDILTLDLV